MKQSYILGAFVSLLLSSSAPAQTNNEYRNRQNAPVTKGYYSIGDNTAKLPVSEHIETEEVHTETMPGKGYYSIGKNQRKQKATLISRKAKKTQEVRQIKKGYYSIGNNAQKL